MSIEDAQHDPTHIPFLQLFGGSMHSLYSSQLAAAGRDVSLMPPGGVHLVYRRVLFSEFTLLEAVFTATGTILPTFLAVHHTANRRVMTFTCLQCVQTGDITAFMYVVDDRGNALLYQYRGVQLFEQRYGNTLLGEY